MPTRPPQHSSMPDSLTIRQVSQRSSKEWVVTTFGKYERAGLEVVVVAVHAHVDEVVDLLAGEHAERRGDVDVDGGPDRRRRPRASAPSACRRGRAPRRRCRTRSPRSPRSAWRRAPARGCSSHTERTGEVNWPDCEQKWQSSGQPPVLSDTMPSTSTLGPGTSSAPRGPARAGPAAGRHRCAAPRRPAACVSGTPRSSTCSRATSRMSVRVTCAVMSLIVAYAVRSPRAVPTAGPAVPPPP